LWVAQADPLGDVEKFIDTQMRPAKVPGITKAVSGDKVSADKASEDKASEDKALEDQASDEQPPKLVKQYLVKWKSRSYLHCSW